MYARTFVHTVTTSNNVIPSFDLHYIHTETLQDFLLDNRLHSKDLGQSNIVALHQLSLKLVVCIIQQSQSLCLDFNVMDKSLQENLSQCE